MREVESVCVFILGVAFASLYLETSLSGHSFSCHHTAHFLSIGLVKHSLVIRESSLSILTDSQAMMLSSTSSDMTELRGRTLNPTSKNKILQHIKSATKRSPWVKPSPIWTASASNCPGACHVTDNQRGRHHKVTKVNILYRVARLVLSLWCLRTVHECLTYQDSKRRWRRGLGFVFYMSCSKHGEPLIIQTNV